MDEEHEDKYEPGEYDEPDDNTHAPSSNPDSDLYSSIPSDQSLEKINIAAKLFSGRYE